MLFNFYLGQLDAFYRIKRLEAANTHEEKLTMVYCRNPAEVRFGPLW